MSERDPSAIAIAEQMAGAGLPAELIEVFLAQYQRYRAG
jgi:hypothetical protein